MESCSCGPGEEELADLMNRQRKVLWAVMAINAAMFVIEVASGILAGSVALLSDAMDFFADTLTYGLTLYVIGRSTRWRTGAALLKGVSLTVFAGVIFYQTVQHSLHPTTPDAATMGAVGFMALAANLGSAALLFAHRSDDLNMQSVWLCSRNDAINNIAVMLAAAGVFATGTGWPDLIIGGIIAAIILKGGITITVEGLRQQRETR